MDRELSVPELRQRQLAPLKHGLSARSPEAVKRRSKIVREFVRVANLKMPWLGDSDQVALKGWAELETLAAMAFTDMKQFGMFDKTGEPRRIISTYQSLRGKALAYAKELGATPASRAELGALISEARESDLASELAKLRLAKAKAKPKDVTPAIEASPDAS